MPGVVCSNHQDSDFGFHVAKIASIESPDDVLCSISSEAEIDRIAFAVEFFPHGFSAAFPTLGDRVSDKREIVAAFLGILVGRLIPTLPPVFITTGHRDRGSVDVIEVFQIVIPLLETA